VLSLLVSGWAAIFYLDMGSNFIPRSAGEIGFRKVRYKDLTVHYKGDLNGGGLGLSYQFVKFIGENIGPVEHIHEYCAGPGFIGFNLLANGLCKTVSFSDINADALDCIRETVKFNGLEDKVRIYLSDCLDDVPKEKGWDLVVGNPPWYLRSKNSNNLIVDDENGRVHRRFFEEIAPYMRENGRIIFVESHEFASLSEFKEVVNRTPCQVSGYHPPRVLWSKNNTTKKIGKVRLPLSLAFSLVLATFILEIFLIEFTLDPDKLS
jgi:methylase of polypeptide subunit release factors